MLGQSFAPLGQEDPTKPPVPGGGAVSPIQQAIKLLSLRLPRVVGAGGIAPQALLQSQGMAGMGQSSNPLMQALMSMVQGGFGGGPQALSQIGPMDSQSPSGFPSAPFTPRIIPINPGDGTPGTTAGPARPQPGARPQPDFGTKFGNPRPFRN